MMMMMMMTMMMMMMMVMGLQLYKIMVSPGTFSWKQHVAYAQNAVLGLGFRVWGRACLAYLQGQEGLVFRVWV